MHFLSRPRLVAAPLVRQLESDRMTRMMEMTRMTEPKNRSAAAGRQSPGPGWLAGLQMNISGPAVVGL